MFDTQDFVFKLISQRFQMMKLPHDVYQLGNHNILWERVLPNTLCVYSKNNENSSRHLESRTPEPPRRAEHRKLCQIFSQMIVDEYNIHVDLLSNTMFVTYCHQENKYLFSKSILNNNVHMPWSVKVSGLHNIPLFFNQSDCSRESHVLQNSVFLFKRLEVTRFM